MYPERSVLDSPTEFGVYSLKRKQKLMDRLASRKEKEVNNTYSGTVSFIQIKPSFCLLHLNQNKSFVSRFLRQKKYQNLAV